MLIYSSCCPESQREAALLLGQFAAADSDCKVNDGSFFCLYPVLPRLVWFLLSYDSKFMKQTNFNFCFFGSVNVIKWSQFFPILLVDKWCILVVFSINWAWSSSQPYLLPFYLGKCTFDFLDLCSHLHCNEDAKMQVHIVQRGAVRPLIDMLQSDDFQLREMSAFALGRLAQVSLSLHLSLPAPTWFPKCWLTDSIQIESLFPFFLKPWHLSMVRPFRKVHWKWRTKEWFLLF